MHLFFNKRLILISLCLVWAELSLLSYLTIQNVKPDFFFIFLVFYAFRVDYRSVVTLALCFGLVKDVFANSFFGLETSSYVGGSILLRFLAAKFDREKQWLQMISLFMFSWFSLILFSFFALLVQKRYGFTPQVAVKAFLISAYTTILGALAIPLFDRWLGHTLRQKQYELF